MPSTPKRILITGGAGFIGSHLVDSYLKDGYTVAVVDNLATGHLHNLNGKPVRLYQSSILDDELDQIFAEFQPTLVSHHAAQVSVRRSLTDPNFDATTNILGTIAILNLAQRYKVSQVLFASSGGAIYGENTEQKPSVEATVPQPTSPYAIAKLAAEHYCHFFAREYQLPITILRYGNVYGPRQDPAGEAGVATLFLEKLAKQESAIIYGSGEQVRDFVSVTDVAAANLAASNQPIGELIRTYNIGSGSVTSIKDLYQKLSRVWQTETGQTILPPTKKPAIAGEIIYSSIDITKAKAELGWQPTKDLDIGLTELVHWFADQAETQQND